MPQIRERTVRVAQPLQGNSSARAVENATPVLCVFAKWWEEGGCVSCFTWTVPVHTCSPGVIINSWPFHAQSDSVWTINYMVILRMGVGQKGVRDGQSPQLEGLGERRVFCLLVLCMQILRNWNGVLRQDWGKEGRDCLSPVLVGPLRAVRFHHFSKGEPTRMETKGTDWSRQPGFQTIASANLGYFLTAQCLSLPLWECG